MNNYKFLSDADLIELLKNNDHTAFAEIFNRYKTVIYLHAYNRIGDRAEAMDMVQDLFATLWDKRQIFELKSNLSGYLYTSIRNKVLTSITHKSVKTNYQSVLKEVMDTNSCITDHLIRENLLANIIEREIDGLPSKMQNIFNLSRKHYLSHLEIAEQLDISPATVKTQINNALRILRKKLDVHLRIFL